MLFEFTVNIKCRLMTLWWFVTLKCCRVAFRTYFHINITFTEHRSAGVNISVMVISSQNKNWTFMGKDWHTDVIKCILFVALLHVSVNTLITYDERRRQKQRNKSTMSPKKRLANTPEGQVFRWRCVCVRCIDKQPIREFPVSSEYARN